MIKGFTITTQTLGPDRLAHPWATGQDREGFEGWSAERTRDRQWRVQEGWPGEPNARTLQEDGSLACFPHLFSSTIFMMWALNERIVEPHQFVDSLKKCGAADSRITLPPFQSVATPPGQLQIRHVVIFQEGMLWSVARVLVKIPPGDTEPTLQYLTQVNPKPTWQQTPVGFGPREAVMLLNEFTRQNKGFADNRVRVTT